MIMCSIPRSVCFIGQNCKLINPEVISPTRASKHVFRTDSLLPEYLMSTSVFIDIKVW